MKALYESVNQLSRDVEEHKESTAAELAGLIAKMETMDMRMEILDSKMDLKVETFNSRMQTSHIIHTQKINTLNYTLDTIDSKIETHTKQINTKLDTLTATTIQLSMEHQNLLTNISDAACTHSEESLELYQNLTHQLESINNKEDSVYAQYWCGGTGGWRRVVYLDMTDSNTTCPSGWQLTGYPKRTCGRVSTPRLICDSTTFPVSGGEYTRVCGRINAYQWGVAYAFYSYDQGYTTNIDGAYADGVSVTHGSPQQHIWTFAAGISEGNPTWVTVCPCDASFDIHVPPYVGEDYFCESGINEYWVLLRHRFLFYPTDTLWDGEDCLPSSTCCSQHNPPYFIKQLPTPTTDAIEARICLHGSARIANIAVELVEMYVQ